MNSGRGVLRTLSNFFFTRKRRHAEAYAKESPNLKCLRTSNRYDASKVNPLLSLPREMLWEIFRNMDIKALVRMSLVSKETKMELAEFLSSTQQVPFLAHHFPALNYHEKCCFMSKLFEIFHTRYSRDRVGMTVRWFKLAFEYRYQIPIAIAFNALMNTFTSTHYEEIFDQIYACWFQEDVKRYIMVRQHKRKNKNLEESLFERFVNLFYNRRSVRLERAVIVSMFLRKTTDVRKQYYLAQLLFSPRNVEDINESIIDFEALEDGDGESLQSQNELDGFPELFHMLNELRNRSTKTKHRWSRGQVFMLLEDVTTQPLWSMANFARLLLHCPFLAVNTTVIRCRNGLYEDAGFVLYHLLLICASHTSALNLLMAIMKELDRSQATQLREQVAEYTFGPNQVGSDKKNEDITEVIQEALDRTFRPLLSKRDF